ncbi:MAG TPA: radical SAM protein, partial [Bacteroidia bacterium]
IHTLLGLLQNSKGDSDFWISTSGFNLTEENALRLKNAGLTGVAISLDHFDAGQHDRFRGYEGAFAAATEGAVRAKKAGLVVALALVPTREFCTEGNLTSYMELAARLGVDFVQLIEPRAVGHYAGKDVELKPAQERVLEDFFTRMNNDPFFAHLPLVHYYGMKQRRMGCAGSGHKYIYVDTDGAMSSCPYCRRKQVSLLDHSLDDAVLRMKEAGCVKFAPVQLM